MDRFELKFNQAFVPNDQNTIPKFGSTNNVFLIFIKIVIFRASNRAHEKVEKNSWLSCRISSNFVNFKSSLWTIEVLGRLHVCWFPREAPIASRDPPSERQKTVSQGSSMVLVWWWSRAPDPNPTLRVGNDVNKNTNNTKRTKTNKPQKHKSKHKN